MPIVDALLIMYPRLIVVDSADGPLEAPLVAESFGLGLVFVVHAQFRVFVWVNPALSPEGIKAYFGSERIGEDLPVIETQENATLQNVILGCYQLSERYLPVEIIPPGSERESIIGELLVSMSTQSGTDLEGFIRLNGHFSTDRP
jgi:hypothetical protein